METTVYGSGLVRSDKLFDIGASEDIVHGNAVKICEYYQVLHGNGPAASFVPRVYGLAGVEKLRHLGLVHVLVLAEVPQSLKVHIISSDHV